MKYAPVAALLISLAAGASDAQKEPGATVEPTVIANSIQGVTRFEGPIELHPKGAKILGGLGASPTVLKKNWGIHGRQHIESFPVDGLTIVRLHSGLVTTTIDGREVKRATGDYWIVPAGSRMTVLVTSESASLQTFSIK
jgi:hypothetical protein